MANPTTLDTLFQAGRDAQEAHAMARDDPALREAHVAALKAYVAEVARLTGETEQKTLADIMHGPSCPCVNCT